MNRFFDLRTNRFQFSDDYDILANSQFLQLRNYFQNLKNDNDDDLNTFIVTFISISRVYEFFFERSPFFISSFEEIKQQKDKSEKPSSIQLIIDLYFEKTEDSRANYVKMRKILQMIKKGFHNSDDFLRNLSLKLNILKRHVRRHISLLKLLRKALKVVIEKQSFLRERKKNQNINKQRFKRMSWMYWYDFLNLIQKILSATKLRQKMHFDMTFYVNESTKFWYSFA